MHSLNTLAVSFTGIFIPIYFLNLHYSLMQVFLYFIVFSLLVPIFFSVFGYFANYIGLRRMVILSFLPLFLYMFFLYYLDRFEVSLYLIASLHAISTSLYWLPLHNFFIENSKEEEMGANVGKFLGFPRFAAIFAPLIGGILAVYYGFDKLILVGSLLYLLSAIPLYFIPDIKPAKVDFRHVFRFVKRYPRYCLAQIVRNITIDMEALILPIFIFITFKDILSVGFIGAFLGAGSFLFILALGRYSDKVDKTIFLKIGGVIMVAIWILRYYASDEITFYALSIFAGFFGALLLVPFNAIAYSLAKKDTVIEFVVFRDMLVSLGRLIIWMSAILFINNMEHLFIFTALVTVYFLFFKQDKLKQALLS